MSEKSLKRLGFLQSGATYVSAVAGTAEKVYKGVRGYTPAFIEPTISSVEDKLAAYTAPVVAKAQDAGEKVLHIADDQVDYLINTAEKTLEQGKKSVTDGLSGVKELHETNVKTFTASSAAYFDYVQRIADWATDKLNPIKGGQAALDTFKAAIAKAQEATDPDVAAKLAADAWTSFSSVPVVSKVLETADPVTQLALQSFRRLHDNLVSWRLYKTVVDTGATTLNWATHSTPYKLGAQYVYPLVQPVADPTLDKLQRSKVISEALQYWKPSATAA